MPPQRGKLLVSFSYANHINKNDFEKAIRLMRKNVHVPDDMTYERCHEGSALERQLNLDYVFLPKLAEIQRKRNEKDLWENNREPGNKISTKDDGSRLIRSISDYSLGMDVDIYKYGKNGLVFILKHSVNNKIYKNFKALPACEDFFYRDWKRDGICVKSTDIFIKRAFATISPESAKQGDFEDAGMIDNDEGLNKGGPEDVARYLNNEGVTEYSGCPPGTWYETDFVTNPYSELQEQTSYHINNADETQEKEIFKKLFPEAWRGCFGQKT